jgi:hypothetical protein
MLWAGLRLYSFLCRNLCFRSWTIQHSKLRSWKYQNQPMISNNVSAKTIRSTDAQKPCGAWLLLLWSYWGYMCRPSCQNHYFQCGVARSWYTNPNPAEIHTCTRMCTCTCTCICMHVQHTRVVLHTSIIHVNVRMYGYWSSHSGGIETTTGYSEKLTEYQWWKPLKFRCASPTNRRYIQNDVGSGFQGGQSNPLLTIRSIKQGL